VKNREIIISDRAVNSLKRIIAKHQLNGFLGADKAKEAIISRLRRLAVNAEKDSRKAKFGRLDGDYRSVLAWNYRIYYRLEDEEVHVLDIFRDIENEVRL
tara:strand:+ start:14280 stop:14579 length:300 start_codon:yes stop_codon:yes gene_type:complete